MARNLPPLRALRAFEAAARHLNFVRAGQEIGVTPGAISHQIKLLEDWVGRALFERRANGVVLTEAGRGFAPQLGAIFDQITMAGLALRAPEGNVSVTLRCQFSVAAKWLAPRLVKFQAAYPEIDLVVSAAPYLWDPWQADPDLSIYYSNGPVPGISRDLLIDGNLIVVVAPAVLAKAPSPLSPGDLLTQPLLRTRFPDGGWTEIGWSTWFAAAGLGNRDVERGSACNLIHLTIEACVAGAGFALVPDVFVRRELSDGSLVAPFDIAVPMPHAYYLTATQANLARAEVETVRGWLLRETQES